MRTLSLASGLFALVAAGPLARADADGLNDALGGSLRASSFGALATSLNPAGAGLSHERSDAFAIDRHDV